MADTLQKSSRAPSGSSSVKRRARTFVERTLDELAERARTGEPEPGIYMCGLCGREDGVQMFTVRNPKPGKVTPGSHYDWGAVAAEDPSEFTGRLICPCCSYAACSHRDGQSRPQFPQVAPSGVGGTDG